MKKEEKYQITKLNVVYLLEECLEIGCIEDYSNINELNEKIAKIKGQISYILDHYSPDIDFKDEKMDEYIKTLKGNK